MFRVSKEFVRLLAVGMGWAVVAAMLVAVGHLRAQGAQEADVQRVERLAEQNTRSIGDMRVTLSSIEARLLAIDRQGERHEQSIDRIEQGILWLFISLAGAMGSAIWSIRRGWLSVEQRDRPPPRRRHGRDEDDE